MLEAADAADMRAARFDQPLRSGQPGLGWGDPLIDQVFADAVERAREQGHQAGYTAGFEQGRRDSLDLEQTAMAERDARTSRDRRIAMARLQTLLEGLAEASRRAHEASVPAWTELADVIADGALAIARAALGRELVAADAPVAEAVRTALRTLGNAPELVVRVNPGDLALLRGLPIEAMPPGLSLVADDSVPAGAALAQTPTQRVRVLLPAAVAAAEEVLRA